MLCSVCCVLCVVFCVFLLCGVVLCDVVLCCVALRCGVAMLIIIKSLPLCELCRSLPYPHAHKLVSEHVSQRVSIQFGQREMFVCVIE